MKLNKNKALIHMARAGVGNFCRLAELCQLSRQTISSYCCGKTVSPASAKKIAEALSVDITEIIED